MTLRRPILAAVLALAVVAPAATASPVSEVSPSGVAVREDPYLPPASPADPGAASVGRRGAERARAASSASAARRRGPTVGRVLLDAVRAGQITSEQRAGYLRAYRAARSARDRVSGTRARELSAVLATSDDLAARRELTASRMPGVFLTLQRNAEYWASRPIPAPGTRLTFTGDPVVLQYYRGQGLQIQPLANFGRVNALWSACDRPRRGTPCLRDDLRALVERMRALASQRGGFTAWEYLFTFAGGRPPWISGLTQGTAIQSLARSSQLLGDPSLLDLARSATGAFTQPPPVGVRVAADGGSHYLIYSFAPRMRVLNAFAQSLIGLFDYAQIAGDPAAQELFDAGDRAARMATPRSDTGAWSLYSEGGAESDLSYHVLLRDFLSRLCDRTGAAEYCDTAERFTRDLSTPPVVAVPASANGRVRRPFRLRLTLSKVSRVVATVRRGGVTVYSRRIVLGRGERTLPWRPAPRGDHEFTVTATDLAGNAGTPATGTLAIR